MRIASAALLATALASLSAVAAEGYQSPYSLKYTHPLESLIGDLQKTPRATPS